MDFFKLSSEACRATTSACSDCKENDELLTSAIVEKMEMAHLAEHDFEVESPSSTNPGALFRRLQAPAMHSRAASERPRGVDGFKMPGPWLSATGDPEAWRSHTLQCGDYVEFVTYDTGRVKQGTVLARIDSLTERGPQGQWTEATFLAVSDEHLSWWLTDGPGVVPIGDLADKKIEWVRRGPHKKYVDEEVKRMAGALPTGKDAGDQAAHGLGFKEAAGLPPADATAEEDALKGLAELEAELGTPKGQRKRKDKKEKASGAAGPLKRETSKDRTKKKKKRRKEEKAAHGRAASAPAEWFGQAAPTDPQEASSSDSTPGTSTTEKVKKKKRRKDRDRARSAQDRGPFGSGHKVDYGGLVVDSDSSDDSQGFRDGLPSGNGTSLQLQLQEYSMKKPGRLAARLLQRMQSMVAKEGGPINTTPGTSRTPPVATNWLLTILEPKQLPIRLMREMKTLATALDQVAAGKAHTAADTIAQRLKALELSQADNSWNRAQFLGKGRSRPGIEVKEEVPDYDPDDVKEEELEDAPQKEEFVGMVLDGLLDFDLGDLGESDDEGLPTGKSDTEYWSNMFDGLSMKDWRLKVRNVLNKRPRIASLGKVYMDAILSLKSALGTFARVHSNPERLPPGDEPNPSEGRPPSQRDVLPMHPALIIPGPGRVTKENVHWIRVVITVLNYLYCAAWAQPVCVPLPRTFSNAQIAVVNRVADQVTRMIGREGTVGPAPESVKKLKAKKFDYNGQPIDHMQDLVAERVIPAWPSVGTAAVVNLEDCLPADLKQAIQDPTAYLLPVAELPDRHRGSRVRATDEEWHKIVRAGYDRGMFTAVRDEDIPVDKRGHLITNGAGGVRKTKEKDGKTIELQRFISILCPTNDAMRLLPGAQDTLPYIWQLPAVMAEKDSYLVLDSEDLQSAFNLFRMPPRWAGFFAFAKKVRGDALGLSRDVEVRPGLTVVLMGWTSAVTLIQAAIRFISYDIGKVPSLGDVRHLKKEIAEGEERSWGKRHAYEKSRELLDLGLGLLSMEMVDEFCLRHWTGKAAFAAAFKRPLFSILQEVYCVMDWAKEGTQITPSAPVIDEVLCFSVLLPLAETDLSSPVSEVISCTDASPSGGGCSIATGFKDKSLLLPLPVEDPGTCGLCQKELDMPERMMPPVVACPEVRGTFLGSQWITMFRGTAGTSFKTEAGKARLDEEEDDGDLMWTHWAPDRHTFSRRQDNVAVRQANAMAKRAVSGLLQAHRRGRFASLENGFGQRLPSAAMVEKGKNGPRWCTTRRPSTLFSTSPSVTSSHLDPENNDDYPWLFCLVFMEGVHDELTQLYTVPFGNKAETLESLMYHQLRGATRGLEDSLAVDWAVTQCVKFLDTMDSGQEAQHLAWLRRHTYHTGCDVRLTDRGTDVVGCRPGPYPAFRWLWRDVLSYKWKQPQHINVLELTAFLAELRRRSRDQAQHGKRFFCVLDSLVTFYVLGKGP
ncbi:unnamed protein product [Symbiodinium sp. CCMP2592]|nr:unnamed protein product [Symbiodinium sp. CCMP2592]